MADREPIRQSNELGRPLVPEVWEPTVRVIPNNERSTRRLRWPLVGLVTAGAVVSGALLYELGASRGSNDSSSQPSTTLSPNAQPQLSSANPNSVGSSSANTLVFDALGGGSSIIQVYPGVDDTQASRQSVAAFNSGDHVTAECKTEGRTVHSHPEVGEKSQSSNMWIRFQAPQPEYATAVYVQDPTVLLGKLPHC